MSSDYVNKEKKSLQSDDQTKATQTLKMQIHSFFNSAICWETTTSMCTAYIPVNPHSRIQIDDVWRIKKDFWFSFYFSFFLYGRSAWCVSFLQALPEDLTSPSDALSCLLPGNGRQKIDAAVSEGEPEGDGRRRKRERRRAGAPGSGGCYFSPFQACAEHSTSPPQRRKKGDVMCYWVSGVKTSHIRVLKSLMTPLRTFFKSRVHPCAALAHFVIRLNTEKSNIVWCFVHIHTLKCWWLVCPFCVA